MSLHLTCLFLLGWWVLLATQVMAAVIPVTDANLLRGLSPYNWVCQPDSISATSNGASVIAQFEGTQQVILQVAADHLITKIPARFPVIAWSVNGGKTQTFQLKPETLEVVLSSGVADPKVEINSTTL